MNARVYFACSYACVTSENQPLVFLFICSFNNSCFLVKLAPAYEGMELGVGDNVLMKAVAESTGAVLGFS